MWGIVMNRRQGGLTIIEMVVTIVILGIALVGITQMIGSGLRSSADTLLETRSVALAQSYLDEIFGKRFDEHSNPRGVPPCRSNCTEEGDFGLDGSEASRVDFDDVDDYHGLIEGDGAATPLQDAEGNERVGYENFRVEISVRYAQPCNDEDEAFFNDGSLVCPPDVPASPEEEEALAEARLRAKVITVQVSHRNQPDGWQFSVYKANF
jgi:MSHA pilin protein MshD